MKQWRARLAMLKTGMFLLPFLLVACAGERLHREGLDQLARGKLEDGLYNLERASKENPDNVGFRTDYLLRRSEQVNNLLAQAQAQRQDGKLDQAEALYLRARGIDAANYRASSGLENIARDRRHLPLLEQARDAIKKGEAERAGVVLKLVLAENPGNAEAQAMKRQMEEIQTREQLVEPGFRSSHRKPINLEFREANLKVVFEALARTSGVNFILDKDIRPDLRTTVFLRQAALEDAIDLLLQTNHLEKKVLNRNTILIYPNSPDKLKDYQELMVKGFYLANADVRQTQSMLKTMLKAKDTWIDEKINLLMMRDTPDAIRLAEKLIAMHDLNEPEVMLEVEVLEVKRTRLLELGVQWPSQLTLAPLNTSGGTSLRLSDLRHLTADRLGAGIGNANVNLRRETGDANILANPRIRARNREKAKIMIGDKVPVSTSVGTNGVITESVQYLDVGLRLEVEPTVYLQDEIAIRIGLEVSSIVNQVKTPAGSLAYQIGSRSVNTLLRLKDGETQVLAGLISDEDRSGASKVPGIGEIPLVGRLFGSEKDDRQKTEIVLSITPRLIRNIARPDLINSEFWSGTETTLRTQPVLLQAARTDEQGKAAAGSANNPVGEPAANGTNSAATNLIKPPQAIKLAWAGPASSKVGENFKLALTMKADGGVRGLPFQLGFDSTALQVVNVAEGTYFAQNDAQSNLSSNVDLTIGKLFGNLTSANPQGAAGDASVVVITFKALAAKATEVKLLVAKPFVVGDKEVPPEMPAPFVISIGNSAP